MALTGKGSWFGGPGDSSDSGHTANGETTKTPGIAVYNHGTLGGYWRVRAPNGKVAVLKQTDIGPAPWTGRKIDVTYSALNKFGFNEGNFPTDSQFSAEYLGRNAPKEATGPLARPASAQQRIPGVPGTPAREELDSTAFRKAGTDAALGKLIASTEGTKGNPLFATGVLSTKEPNPAEYQKTIPGTPGTPARTIPGAPPSRQPGGTAGGKLGGFLSPNASLEYKRADEGKDVQLKPGEALHATGDFEVVAVKFDPSGFGPDYPVIKFTSGPQAGQVLYFGHGDSLVRQGQKGAAGTPIVRTSKTGHNAPPGWLEIGKGETIGQGDQGQGRAVERYLR
jgi:hypothetical protein